ncbi:unnamed protein product [Symbiodinium sp. CCMP2592]|nr:unnamed protein product [Symbiodinium sp. CCMP2592]
MGLQYVASTSGSYTRRVQPIPAGELCGTPYCSRDEGDCPFCEDLLEGRLGASQLGGRFRLHFLASSGKLIILEICFEVPSFFATSKDSDLVVQLQQLLPWSIEGSDSEEVESSAAYVTDEDEAEDDDAAEEEEEEEEVEDEAMADAAGGWIFSCVGHLDVSKESGGYRIATGCIRTWRIQYLRAMVARRSSFTNHSRSI